MDRRDEVEDNIRDAVEDFYYALDCRANGYDAQEAALKKIEKLLDLERERSDAGVERRHNAYDDVVKRLASKDPVERVRAIVEHYHHALDDEGSWRNAGSHAFDAVQDALGMERDDSESARHERRIVQRSRPDPNRRY